MFPQIHIVAEIVNGEIVITVRQISISGKQHPKREFLTVVQ